MIKNNKKLIIACASVFLVLIGVLIGVGINNLRLNKLNEEKATKTITQNADVSKKSDNEKEDNSEVPGDTTEATSYEGNSDTNNTNDTQTTTQSTTEKTANASQSTTESTTQAVAENSSKQKTIKCPKCGLEYVPGSSGEAGGSNGNIHYSTDCPNRKSRYVNFTEQEQKQMLDSLASYATKKIPKAKKTSTELNEEGWVEYVLAEVPEELGYWSCVASRNEAVDLVVNCNKEAIDKFVVDHSDESICFIKSDSRWIRGYCKVNN